MRMVADCTTKPTRKRRTVAASDHKTTRTTVTTTRRRKTMTAYYTANLTGPIMQHTGLENSAPIDQNAIC